MLRSKPNRPVAERIRAASCVDPESGCWNWTKHVKPDGYGRMSVAGRMVTAHRASLEAVQGPIAKELDVDHLCRNRRCVNPAHLEAVDRRTNVLRGVSFGAVNAAKTSCNHGHPFNPANTGRRPDGTRQCRACAVAATKRYRMKRKSA